MVANESSYTWSRVMAECNAVSSVVTMPQFIATAIHCQSFTVVVTSPVQITTRTNYNTKIFLFSFEYFMQNL